jgi:NADH:ubiquinone oxidoreductase subunit 5 (subunit L)/multisubunit Na+/H+ antiporter MnhA subunit
MFIFLIASFSVFYTFDILAINNQGFLQLNMYLTFFNIQVNFIEFLCFCLLGAAFIKSAQFGGHT